MRLFSTKAPRRLLTMRPMPDGSYLFFGRETKGLPEPFLEAEHYDDMRPHPHPRRRRAA